MSNENRLSFNLKAKKTCDAVGMILHCENQKARKKSTNIVYPENTKLNINSPDILKKYDELTGRIETIKGRKIQKNANHYLEGVLAFPEHLVNEMGIEKFREKAPELIEKYMEEIKEAYGFEPCGFSLHFDEGHKPDKDGKQSLNIHAHLSFVNYDFKQNKARFREIQQKYVSKRKVPNMAFVAMQDLAGQVFEPLGFKRGISKQVTGLDHKDKEAFVQGKIDNLENQVKELTTMKNELLTENILMNDTLLKAHKENSALKLDLEALKGKFKQWFKTSLNYIKTSLDGYTATSEASAVLDEQPEQQVLEMVDIDSGEINKEIDKLANNDQLEKQSKVRKKTKPTKP
jgi:hypothetical protein